MNPLDSLPVEPCEPDRMSDKSGSAAPSVPLEPVTMQSSGEYDALRQRLLLTTIVCSAAISGIVALSYPLDIVANYAIGSAIGLVYFRMLARAVARLSPQHRSLGFSRLALFAALIVVATRVEFLQVLPIFLGFLTYKAALFVYAFQTLVGSLKSKAL